MTSVGPDLLLPGVASKKPAAASGEAPVTPNAGDADGFAEELDVVVSSESPSTSSAQETPTNENPTPSAPGENATGAVPPATSGAMDVPPIEIPATVGPSVDAAELHLFNPVPQTDAPVETASIADGDSIVPETGDGLAPLIVAQEVSTVPLLTPVETASATSETPTPAVAPIVAPALGGTTADDIEPITADALALVEGVVAAPRDTDSALTQPIVVPNPDEQLIRQSDTEAPADESGLLSAAATINSGVAAGSITQAQGQGANPTPAVTPQTSQNQGPSPAVLAASLSIDPSGLRSANADGSPDANLQNNDKAALRTAASLTTDAKPMETAGTSSFSSALGAATSEAAGQSARGAAQAAAQRPARPAQTAPPTAQIAVHIVRAVGDGISRFNVQLHPAELGRVEVKMEVGTDGAVRALVTADRQETVDQLQRDSRALERALQEAGLKADSQNLHFSLRGGQNGRGLSENRTSIGNSGDADLTEVPEPALAAHWSNVAGSTGALDIRV